MAFFESVIAEISAFAIVRAATSSLKAIASSRSLSKLGIPVPQSLYLRELKRDFREMPFLYPDFDGDCIKDFVDIQVVKLNLATLESGQSADREPSESRLLKRKILMIGSAGVGKTTFQKHALVMVASGQAKSRFTLPAEHPLPIYVPLKEVDNSKPQPILNYILSGVSLFRHRGGLTRLRTLAAQRRLFLFIDGYDEIAVTEGAHNHVRDELEALLFPREFRLNGPYLDLEMCRIWFATRREFFIRNPTAFIGFGRSSHPSNLYDTEVGAVELRGLRNRENLVQIIFDKYIAVDPRYKQWLDNEEFLNRIDGSHDAELRELSFNPLFLSVMCFVYAKAVEREETHEVDWVGNVQELINKCMDLLLFELDDLKAKNEPTARRAALGKRRGAFRVEKRRFLERFAFQLYEEDKTLFTLDYLTLAAEKFLVAEQMPERVNASRFVDQVINCGVIKEASISRNPVEYDFRHQYFRQVLAGSFAATPELYVKVLTSIDKEQFKELLSGLRRLPRFSDSAFQGQALSTLLQDVTQGRCGDGVALTAAFVNSKPASYDISPVVDRFVLNTLLSEAPRFRVSKNLLLRATISNETLGAVRLALLSAIAEGRLDRLSLCCSVLSYCNPLLLRQIIEEQLSNEGLSEDIRGVLIEYACVIHPQWIRDQLEHLMENDKTFVTLCWILANAVADNEAVRGLVEDIRARVTDDRLRTLLVCCLSVVQTRDDSFAVVDLKRALCVTHDSLQAVSTVFTGLGWPLVLSKAVMVRSDDLKPTRKAMFIVVRKPDVEAMIQEIHEALEEFLFQVHERDELRGRLETHIGSVLSKTLALLQLREAIGLDPREVAKAVSTDDLKNSLDDAICARSAVNMMVLKPTDKKLLRDSRLTVAHFFI